MQKATQLVYEVEGFESRLDSFSQTQPLGFSASLGVQRRCSHSKVCSSHEVLPEGEGEHTWERLLSGNPLKTPQDCRGDRNFFTRQLPERLPPGFTSAIRRTCIYEPFSF